MTDPGKLAERLKAFSNSLEAFDRDLQEQLVGLNAAWARVNRVWEGEAYQEFVGSWQSILQRITEYVDSCRKYEAFLEERIAALNRLNESGGLG